MKKNKYLKTMKKEEITKGVKGFDKDLKCRGFQFKEGEIFETDKKPARCTENGFHFCENPLDVFAYYPPSDSIYHAVEGIGQKDTSDEDSKIAVSKIKIGAQISLFEMIKLGVECILKRVDVKNALATNTGDSSAATNTGDRSAAIVGGKDSIACGLGIDNKARACRGSFIVLAEWENDENRNWHIKHVKSAKIDGKKLKADTFYMLKNGRFVEVE